MAQQTVTPAGELAAWLRELSGQDFRTSARRIGTAKSRALFIAAYGTDEQVDELVGRAERHALDLVLDRDSEEHINETWGAFLLLCAMGADTFDRPEGA